MISIIMPTYNRFGVVQETINKAITAIVDIDAEIIIINDGEDLPFTISHIKLSIYKNQKKGVSSARNFGASKSKYPILLFIDDDMWITTATLQLIIGLWKSNQLEHNTFNLNWIYPVELQEKLKIKKIGRYILNANYHKLEGRSCISVNYQLETMDMLGVGSCSFCITKENFNSIGGYNEKIDFQGEDIDIASRLDKNHIHTKLATKITCYHNQEDRLEIDGFIDRIYRGYLSQAKAGMLNTTSQKHTFYSILLPLFSAIKFLYNAIPNRPIFDKLSFRLIGILSSIARNNAVKMSNKML
jgi:glycosyltransferase involved in cell wall biosynthesis